jgi:diguanylate cyclase (GGDEF)-like protein/PAS domain S-box-containing protein
MPIHKLNTKEDLFHTIAECSTFGIYILQNGIIKYANRALGQILGIPEEDLLGADFFSFVHPDDRQRVRQKISQCLNDEAPTGPYTFRCRCSNGDVVHVEASDRSIECNEGRVLVGNLTNITSRKRLEAELEREREIFNLFMEYSPIYVFIKNQDIRTVRLSKNYETMLGKPLADLLDKRMAELFPPDLAQSMEADDRRILEEGKPLKVVEAFNGRVYETMKFPILRPGQPAYLAGFTIDITERYRAEKALQKAHRELKARFQQIKQLQEQLLEQLIRDPLTGLFNRRYLQETLDREFARASREKKPVSLIMMDIDHFKRINDSYGHRAGDKVLAELGQLLANNIRTEDIPCRYGGEEFVIVMPGAPLDIASERAEQIRLNVHNMCVSYRNQPIQITMSLGVAAYPIHGNNSDAVLIRADRALYHAKQNGRNRVVVYRSTAAMPPP